MTSRQSALTCIEVVVIVVALYFCVRWINDPQGPFEPLIAFCTLLLSSADLWRRNRGDALPTPEPLPKPSVAAVKSAPIAPNPLTPFAFASGNAFFAHRFAQAFPGLREPTWFRGKEAVERLAILLASPLRFALSDRGEIAPIWWLRSANNAIDQFSVLSPTSVLLDHQEFPVKRICAFYSKNYKHLFVYVEADPSPPTGLYPRTSEQFQATLDEFGYVWEEYGLFKDTHLVTRAEYDDNCALILGKVVPLGDQCQLRSRYLSRYNFIICGSDSPINDHRFDQILERYMNRLLAGEDCLTEFADLVKRLPHRSYG